MLESYALYALKFGRRKKDDSITDTTKIIEEIQNRDISPHTLNWIIFNLNKSYTKKLYDESLRVLKDGYVPDNDFFPLWIYDGKINNTIEISRLKKYPMKKVNINKGLSKLDTQSKLELIYASAGQKVSRISVYMDSIFDLQSDLDVPLLCSREMYTHIQDKRILKYSNIASEKTPIKINKFKSHKKNNMVDIYISRNWLDATLSYSLDRENKSGELLGIPNCCRKFFRNNWENCVIENHGDLAFQLIKVELDKSKIQINKYSNPYSMYFGGSFLSHFPCSINCLESIKLAKFREKFIRDIDIDLSNQVMKNHIRKFFLDINGNVYLKEQRDVDTYEIIPN